MQLEAGRQGRTERSRPNGRAVSFIETPDAGAPVLGTLTTPPPCGLRAAAGGGGGFEGPIDAVVLYIYIYSNKSRGRFDGQN